MDCWFDSIIRYNSTAYFPGITSNATNPHSIHTMLLNGLASDLENIIKITKCIQMKRNNWLTICAATGFHSFNLAVTRGWKIILFCWLYRYYFSIFEQTIKGSTEEMRAFLWKFHLYSSAYTIKININNYIVSLSVIVASSNSSLDNLLKW